MRFTPRPSTSPSTDAADPRSSFSFPPNARRVWIPDTTEGFLPGWIKSSGDETDQGALTEVVVAATGEVRQLPMYSLSPMNPPQFDGVDDIADLTHLNEASVINNLKTRYGAANIYVRVHIAYLPLRAADKQTYSG